MVPANLLPVGAWFFSASLALKDWRNKKAPSHKNLPPNKPSQVKPPTKLKVKVQPMGSLPVGSAVNPGLKAVDGDQSFPPNQRLP